jgi:hypothetical protein
MGLTPPSFLFRPMRVAPKKNGRAVAAISPEITKLTNLVKDDTN